MNEPNSALAAHEAFQAEKSKLRDERLEKSQKKELELTKIDKLEDIAGLLKATERQTTKLIELTEKLIKLTNVLKWCTILLLVVTVVLALLTVHTMLNEKKNVVTNNYITNNDTTNHESIIKPTNAPKRP